MGLELVRLKGNEWTYKCGIYDQEVGTMMAWARGLLRWVAAVN